MALYSGRLLMRGGNESDFDADKMMPREWSVSTDKKIVRICIAPGICIRMATYEAFEEDMAKIENILKECQSIQEVVVRINAEVSQNADAVAEYTEQAKQYRDEAKQFRDEAFATTPDGYENVVKNVEKNTVKIDTIIEKADLGIKETASGEEIHLTDSAEGKAVEFALYGKAKQNTTRGNQLLDDTTLRNVVLVGGYSKIDVSLNGSGKYTLSVDIEASSGGLTLSFRDEVDVGIKNITSNLGTTTFELTDEEISRIKTCSIFTFSQSVGKTLKYIMLNKGETALPYEPYTGGQPSPNPDYPQEIEVSGESYNLLENKATSQTINGVTFTVNEDKSVTVKGKATDLAYINVGSYIFGEKVILSGCPSGGSANTYSLYAYGTTLLGRDIGSGVEIQANEQADIRVMVASGVTIDTTFYPMLRKASVKNDRYMPYGKGSVEVQSHGENLCDIQEATTMHKLPFPLKAGTYTISFKTTATQGGFIMSNTTNTATNSIGKVSNINSKGYVVITITTDFETNYISISATPNNDVAELMLNKGTTPLPFEPYKETLATIPTENGLAGIKVDSGGNYTDSNGQQWICDEVVKYADGSGAYIQRLNVDTFNHVDDIQSNGVAIIKVANKHHDNASWGTAGRSMCNLISNNYIYNDMVGAIEKSTDKSIYSLAGTNSGFYIYCIYIPTIEQTVEAYNEFLNNTPITFVSIKPEPIRKPLTAEEIAEIEKLHTFYPITNISNDADCGIKVTYLADGKNYIDNQLALQAQAQENALLNMLLLMPEETQAAMIENDTNNLLAESEE